MNLVESLPLVLSLAAALILGFGWLVLALPNLALALFGLVATLPFERVPSWEIAGTTLRFNQLAAVIFILIVVVAAVGGRLKLRPFPLWLPLLGFFILNVWTAPYALNAGRAFSVLGFVLLMAATSAAVPQALTDKTKLPTLGRLLLVLTAGVALFSLFQFVGDLLGLPRNVTLLKVGYGREVFGFPRVHAFAQEPLYLANFLFIPLGALLGLLLTKQKSIKPRFLMAGALTGGIVFALTLSRGAFLAAVPFTVTLLVFFGRRFLTWRHTAAFLGGLLIVGSVVWGILGLVDPGARSRFIEHATLQDFLVTREGESVFGRLEAYSDALEIWRQKPWTGIGLGNFGPAIAPQPQVRPDTGWDIVNNQYLELLAETGLIGLLLMLIFWIGTVWRSLAAFWKTDDPLIKGLLGGLTAALVAVLVQYNFFSTLYIMHIWVLVGLLVALQNLALAETKAS